MSIFISLSRWVHLVCALYTPGITFDVPEKLEGVVLVDMHSSRWGAKVGDLKCIEINLRWLRWLSRLSNGLPPLR